MDWRIMNGWLEGFKRYVKSTLSPREIPSAEKSRERHKVVEATLHLENSSKRGCSRRK